MSAKKATGAGKSVVRAYTLRRLEPGEFEIQMSYGARPFLVRDDGGQLKIYALEDPSGGPTTFTFTLLATGGIPIEKRFAQWQFIGSANISGEVWHVFRWPVA